MLFRSQRKKTKHEGRVRKTKQQREQEKLESKGIKRGQQSCDLGNMQVNFKAESHEHVKIRAETGRSYWCYAPKRSFRPH